MTLLLAAVTHHGIVMLSDGRCRNLSETGPPAILAEDLQKLFPFEVTGRPLAIAHHGQNRLNGRAIREIIGDQERACRGVASVQDIAEKIKVSLDQSVRNELRRLRADGVNDGCGFWVGGYGVDQDLPSLYEVFWKPGGEDVEFKPIAVLGEGGDGARFSQAARKESANYNFTEQSASDWTLARWSDYLERLYKAAANREGAEKVFGGKRRNLWIEKTGTKWINQ